MNLYNNLIKTQDIKLTDLKERLQPRFIKTNFQTKSDDICKSESKVEAEIKEIRREAQERIKITNKEAYDRGFSEGLWKGMDQEKKKLYHSLESFTKLINDLKILKDELFENSEKEIIDLVFLIAKKVIHREVDINREIIVSVLRDTIKDVRDKEGIKIRLNPKDYHYIMEATPDFLSKFCDIKNTLIEDEEIGRGGAVIETHSVGIDATLDQQLNRIKDTLPFGK
jgi:flagellar assembly protein FliH